MKRNKLKSLFLKLGISCILEAILSLIVMALTLILGSISGVIILLSKLIDMIKRIFDQQRDISQILAIAETIDKKTTEFFVETVNGEEAFEEKIREIKNPHFKFIAHYLQRIGAKEIKTKNQMTPKQILKTVTQIAQIIKKN